MISTAASLNFAAFSQLVQSEALSLVVSALVVVGVITLIEQFILNPDPVCRDLCRDVCEWLREVQAKGFAHGKAQVLEFLETLALRVSKSLTQVLSIGSNWRTWWTWKRTVVASQAALGVVCLIAFSMPLLLVLNEVSDDMGLELEQPMEHRAKFSSLEGPCPDAEQLLAPPVAQVLAPMAVFVSGALMHCKAFMRIPLL